MRLQDEMIEDIGRGVDRLHNQVGRQTGTHTSSSSKSIRVVLVVVVIVELVPVVVGRGVLVY